MSTIAALITADLNTHALAAGHLVTALPAAGDGDGILNLINSKALQGQDTGLNVGKAVIIAVTVFGLWRARGALALSAMYLGVAALCWYGLNNIPGLSSHVDKEVNGLRPLSVNSSQVVVPVPVHLQDVRQPQQRRPV
jgi:hypothetical protein